jgi:prophage DNA circulation protein
MNKIDATEAAAIAVAVLDAILDVTPTKGRPGADLRTTVGDFETHAAALIQDDQSGPPLAEIFDLTRKNGAPLARMNYIRDVAVAQTARTPGGVLMKNSLIHLSLATEADIIAATTFTSRNEVMRIKDYANEAFSSMEDLAADAMDSNTYRALITLNAAVAEYLVTAQYPLPEMRAFQFAAAGPTLVQAYKLYDDASRADELRENNRVIHPAFAKPYGVALSS